MPSELIRFSGGISRLRNASPQRPYNLFNAKVEPVGTIRGLARGSAFEGPHRAKPFIYAWDHFVDDASTAKALTNHVLLINSPVEDGCGQNLVYDGVDESGELIPAPGLPYITSVALETTNIYQNVDEYPFTVKGKVSAALDVTWGVNGPPVNYAMTEEQWKASWVMYMNSVPDDCLTLKPNVLYAIAGLFFNKERTLWYLYPDVPTLDGTWASNEHSGVVIYSTERSKQGISTGYYVSYLLVPYNIRKEQGPPTYFHVKNVDQFVSAIPKFVITASSDTDYIEVYRTVEHNVERASPVSNSYHLINLIGRGEAVLGGNQVTQTVNLSTLVDIDGHPWCEGDPMQISEATVEQDGIYISTTRPPEIPTDIRIRYYDDSEELYHVNTVTPLGGNQYLISVWSDGPDHNIHGYLGQGLSEVPLILWSSDPCQGPAHILERATVLWSVEELVSNCADPDLFYVRDATFWNLEPDKLIPDVRAKYAGAPTSPAYGKIISAATVNVEDDVLLREVEAKTVLVANNVALYGNVKYPVQEPPVIALVHKPEDDTLPHIALQYEYRQNMKVLRGPMVPVLDEDGLQARVQRLSVDTRYAESALLVWIDYDRTGEYFLYERIVNAAGRYVSNRNELIRELREGVREIEQTYWTFTMDSFDDCFITMEEPDEDLEVTCIEEPNTIIASVTGQPLSTEYAAIVLPVDEEVRLISRGRIEEEQAMATLLSGEIIYVFTNKAVRAFVRQDAMYQMAGVIAGLHGIALHDVDQSPIYALTSYGVVYVDTEGNINMIHGRQETQIDFEVKGLHPFSDHQKTMYDPLWSKVVSLAYHDREKQIYALTDTGTWIFEIAAQQWVGHYDYAYPRFLHVEYHLGASDPNEKHMFVTSGFGEEEGEYEAVLLDESGLLEGLNGEDSRVDLQIIFGDTDPVWIHEVRADFAIVDDENRVRRKVYFHQSVQAAPEIVDAQTDKYSTPDGGVEMLPRRSLYPRLRGVAHRLAFSNFKELLNIRYWFVPHPGRN